MTSTRQRLTFFLAAFLATCAPAYAYIGPGAGVAFVSSFLVVLLTLALAVFTLLTWPLRWVVQTLRGRTAHKRARVRRVVILGLDGQDPQMTEQLMEEGLLPHFSQLRQQGAYTHLQTSLPAESPVAWSCFQTGCNPGKHRVFDFLVPNRTSYHPELCSARIDPPARTLKIGPYVLPLSKPGIEFERKSTSFWKILGDFGIFSTVLRVPTSFPPEKFNGVLLSAMSVPDLRGTQGTFSYFCSDSREVEARTGGEVIPVELHDGVARTHILGPKNPIRDDARELKIPLRIEIGSPEGDAVLSIGDKRYPLVCREFSPWIPLEFRAGLGMRVRGMSRFYLMETKPHLRLYMTPINIHPDRPVLPVSSPVTYSMYLSRTQGPFSTLGLAEDTWALNERVLDEEAFLKQAYLIHQEREDMFFDALEKTRRGSVVCVFDITDRLQHMFWRYLEEDHPANDGKDAHNYRDEISRLYQNMDDLVGRTMQMIDEETLLIVMSDHGFRSFRRGVNVNSWLHEKGYLVTRGKPSGQEWFEDVDWSRTRAYAVGLGGIYLNLKGRESKGIVEKDEAAQLKTAIREQLQQLQDDRTGESAVARVYDTEESYSGPYAGDGPDLVIGFRVGYRASWLSVTGGIAGQVFEDNRKSWSGDHCMNPPDVPGILFCNRPLDREDVGIMDIAPTVLDLFGIPVPAWMDGTTFLGDTGVSGGSR